MRATIGLLTLLLSTTATSSPVDQLGDDARVGAYACVVHRTAGIQGKGEARRAGAIQLGPAEAAFTLTVKKVSSQEKRDIADACQAGRVGKNRKLVNGLYTTGFEYWFTCDANYELQMSSTKLQPTLRGDSTYVFLDSGPFARFGLFKDLGFVYAQHDTSGNSYIEEGQCQKM
mgnify:CR=1 FL=1